LTAKVDAAGWARFVIRVSLLLLAVIACVTPHLFWQLFRLPSPWPRFFMILVTRICGVRRKSVGVPLKRDVFFVANHLSWLDIPVIASANGTAFIAKEELSRAPVVGWLARMNRTVFVSRADRMGVAEQINQLRDALAEAWAVTIFPEGTTTDGQSLLPFKPSLLAVLDPPPPGIMVQPVVLDYGRYAQEIAWVGVEEGQDNAVRILTRKGTIEATVHFLDPFNPRDFPGRKAINAEARRRIEDALVAIRGRPLRPFPGHDALATVPPGVAYEPPADMVPVE